MFILETVKYDIKVDPAGVSHEELFGRRPIRQMWGPYPDFIAATTAMDHMTKEFPVILVHTLHPPEAK